MRYEQLKRERDQLCREIGAIDAICRENFLISISSDAKITYSLVGASNKNRQPDEHEQRATEAIKAALTERAIPMRERLALIDKRLAAADELLKGV